MSQFEKAKERLLSLPKDFTYDEARVILNKLGFVEYNKGKTSGSRVKFYRESDKRVILLHKPHPSSIIIKESMLKYLADTLKGLGEI